MDAPRFSIVTPVYKPPAGVLRDTALGAAPDLRATGSGRWSTTRLRRARPRHPPRGRGPATPASGSSSGRPTATSSRRPTTAWRPREASSSPCSTTRPPAEEALEQVSAAVDRTPTSTTSTPTRTRSTTGAHYERVRQARLVADPAARPDVHQPPLRASPQPRGGGGRVPPRLRGQPGPRPRPAGHRAGPRVVHVPEVLYHWRVVPGSTAGDAQAKPYAAVAGRKAVQEALDRRGAGRRGGRRATGPWALPRRGHAGPRHPGSASSSPPSARRGIVWLEAVLRRGERPVGPRPTSTRTSRSSSCTTLPPHPAC